jgi:helicase MOV-10
VNHILNEEQLLAVSYMLKAPFLHAPYVLFGPPGTGKTVTIVEYIIQVVRLTGGTKRVLVCAASNEAANVIARRLQQTLSRSELMRMYANSRNFSDVPASLRDYCNVDRATQMFYSPEVEELQTFAVIVCTCCAGGRLYNKGVPRGHFECIVVDEAGTYIYIYIYIYIFVCVCVCVCMCVCVCVVCVICACVCVIVCVYT